MPKQNRCNTTAIYFTEKLQKQMDMLLDYPCTLLEAPMGYGKTTAVRENLLSKNVDIFWLKIYDNSITAFWVSFCRLFNEINEKYADDLMQIGFPNDITSMQEAAMLLQSIQFSKETVIVLDDYHLIDSTKVSSFIEFLVWNEIDKLHIVLTARYTSCLNTGEMLQKGYLHHITKESFELSPEEIVIYYKLCGINISGNDADRLFNYTEGWISALYLMMLNFKADGQLNAALSIAKLVEKTIYLPFSEEIKKFLLNLSFFDSFTMEQADEMWQKGNTEKLLSEIISKNAFVSFDVKTGSYQVHKIFQEFLKDIFEKMDSEYKNLLYRRAAGWYMKTGDYLSAMYYYNISGDFESLMSALEADKGHSIRNEHKTSIIQCFKDCPQKVRQNHPIALLIYALCLFSFNENELFEEVCGEFTEVLTVSESLDPETKNELIGEFELLLSFADYNDISKMYEHNRKAYEYLKHPSRFMDTQGGWTFGSPSVLYMFHRETGQLQNEVRNIKQAVPLYSALADGHGTGGEYVMEAEEYFNHGDFDNANITADKALYLAESRGQQDIVICANFLKVRIAAAKGDYTQAVSIFQKLSEDMKNRKWYSLVHTLELCEAYIHACLQQGKGIPKWIADGNFDSSRLYFPAMAFLNIVYGRVLLVREEYHKLLGTADQFIEIASVFPNLLGQIYSYIYIAAANVKLYRHDEALSALKKALDIALPDKLYMPFVENCDYVKPLMEEVQCHSSFNSDIENIFMLYISYRCSAEKIKQEHFVKVKPRLTDREMEVARLVAEGMSNSEIGKRLYITQNTVKTLLKRVFEKLDINSRIMLKQYIEDEA